MYGTDVLENELGELEETELAGEEEGMAYEGDFEAAEASYEDLESDPFIGEVIKKAVPIVAKAVQSGSNKAVLQNVAKQAAQAAGAAIAGPKGAKIAGQIATKCLKEMESGETAFEDELEAEGEPEGSDNEAEDEAQYYAYMASEAQTEEEADQFLGALVPIISQVAGPLLSGILGGGGASGGDSDGEGDPFLGDILGGLLGGDQEDMEGDPFLDDIIGGLFGEEGEGALESDRDEFLPALIPMVAPLIGKGIGAIGKMLGKNRRTRGGIKALPRIGVGAARAVGNMARRGRRITPSHVAAAVGQQAARTFGSRPRLNNAIRRNRIHARHAQRRYPPRPQPRPQYWMPPRPRPTVASGRRMVGYIPVYAPRRRLAVS